MTGCLRDAILETDVTTQVIKEEWTQVCIPVKYAGENVSDFAADLVVEEKIIVALKSVQRLIKAHEIQLVNYLVATGIPVGLLINFGETRADVKRKVRQLTN